MERTSATRRQEQCFLTTDRFGGVHGISTRAFFPHLGLSCRAHFNWGQPAAHQLGEPVPATSHGRSQKCVFDLGANLLHTSFDFSRLPAAFDDGGMSAPP